MRILVIGLGSMGRRRIRNLRELGVTGIVGFDMRADRRAAASADYGIATVDSLDEALLGGAPDAVIVSTSPAGHRACLEWAAAAGAHCFVEASVSSAAEADEITALAARSRKVMVPSCTMSYFQGPTRVKQIVGSGAIGRPLLLTHHVGQYLPDWHPWEEIGSFYVSQRDTGGCREIVPFEFTWLNDVFGDPRPLFCRKGVTGVLPVDIDDHYHSVVEYPGGLVAAVTIDVLSRPQATREFRLIGSEGVVSFSGERGVLEVSRAGSPEGTVVESLSQGSAESGYIYPEVPYVSEMRDFLAAAEAGDASLFPNDFARDARVLYLLNELEAIST